MTGTEMVTKFREMVDDQLDSDLELQLLNDARCEIEGSHIWEQLKAVDSSQTETTSSIALPTRFALPISLYIGTEYEPYTLIPFENARLQRDFPRAFYIDLANGVYYLTGSRSSTNTIYFYHTKYSADIAAGTSWAFPSRFHYLIPLKMAQMYYAADAGEKGRAWDDRWSAYFEKGMGLMQSWDDQLKMRARRGTRGGMRNSDLPRGIANF